MKKIRYTNDIASASEGSDDSVHETEQPFADEFKNNDKDFDDNASENSNSTAVSSVLQSKGMPFFLANRYVFACAVFIVCVFWCVHFNQTNQRGTTVFFGV